MLEARFSGIAGKSIAGVPAELGTITETGLLLDSFKHEIPDYLVADWLVKVHLPDFSLIGTTTSPVNALGEPLVGASTSQLTRFDFKETVVDEVRMNWQAGIQPGDRVLVVPVNGGKEFIILCRVVEANG
ncbi:DUF2577 domain-containing protein [Cohnella silvisoli]|uniref:DUF2577 domain-containing protein n=1 Tax=Cohnella silvisoli TaxID=2873699 RepID=A0ABV1L307_9BACL|nr:DUF2577 domain-containing protein [Cohnella silvisoli]MCD9025743.1 DUF2577 domain-containing protein [Cohnella silvisoli]